MSTSRLYKEDRPLRLKHSSSPVTDMGENVDGWDRKIVDVLMQQNPWVAKVQYHVRITAKSNEGYAVGFVELTPRTPPAKVKGADEINALSVPIIISNFRLHPLDTFYYKGSYYPLGEERAMSLLQVPDVFMELDRDVTQLRNYGSNWSGYQSGFGFSRFFDRINKTAGVKLSYTASSQPPTPELIQTAMVAQALLNAGELLESMQKVSGRMLEALRPYDRDAARAWARQHDQMTLIDRIPLPTQTKQSQPKDPSSLTKANVSAALSQASHLLCLEARIHKQSYEQRGVWASDPQTGTAGAEPWKKVSYGELKKALGSEEMSRLLQQKHITVFPGERHVKSSAKALLRKSQEQAKLSGIKAALPGLLRLSDIQDQKEGVVSVSSSLSYKASQVSLLTKGNPGLFQKLSSGVPGDIVLRYRIFFDREGISERGGMIGVFGLNPREQEHLDDKIQAWFEQMSPDGGLVACVVQGYNGSLNHGQPLYLLIGTQGTSPGTVPSPELIEVPRSLTRRLLAIPYDDVPLSSLGPMPHITVRHFAPDSQGLQMVESSLSGCLWSQHGSIFCALHASTPSNLDGVSCFALPRAINAFHELNSPDVRGLYDDVRWISYQSAPTARVALKDVSAGILYVPATALAFSPGFANTDPEGLPFEGLSPDFEQALMQASGLTENPATQDSPVLEGDLPQGFALGAEDESSYQVPPGVGSLPVDETNLPQGAVATGPQTVPQEDSEVDVPEDEEIEASASKQASVIRMKASSLAGVPFYEVVSGAREQLQLTGYRGKLSAPQAEAVLAVAGLSKASAKTYLKVLNRHLGQEVALRVEPMNYHAGSQVIDKARKLSAKRHAMWSAAMQDNPGFSLEAREASRTAAAYLWQQKTQVTQKISANMVDVGVDAALSLGFLTPTNIAKFVDWRPELETVQSMLCALRIAARMGLSEIPVLALTMAVDALEPILSGLRTLELSAQVGL